MIRCFAFAGLVFASALLPVSSMADPGITSPGLTLFEDNNFEDTKYSVSLGTNISDMDSVGFGDEADSIKWQLPRSWCIVLYESSSYRKPRLILRGTGEHAKLDSLNFGDEVDSLRWTRGQLNLPGIPVLGK